MWESRVSQSFVRHIRRQGRLFPGKILIVDPSSILDLRILLAEGVSTRKLIIANYATYSPAQLRAAFLPSVSMSREFLLKNKDAFVDGGIMARLTGPFGAEGPSESLFGYHDVSLEFLEELRGEWSRFQVFRVNSRPTDTLRTRAKLQKAEKFLRME